MLSDMSPRHAVPQPEPSKRHGRVDVYIHNDSISRHKGAAMVKVTCDSEAGSRTTEFAWFTQTVAKFAYAASATTWADIVEAYPDVAAYMADLQAKLKETITVTDVTIMTV